MSPKISSVVLEDVEDEVEAAEGDVVSIEVLLLQRMTIAPAFTDVTSPSDRRTDDVNADAASPDLPAVAGRGGRSSCSRMLVSGGAEAGSTSTRSMSVESLLKSPDVKLMVAVQLEEESL